MAHLPVKIMRIINRHTINVKKTTVYTHVNGDRPSHIENSKNKKVILLHHCTSWYVNVQQYSKI